MLIVRPIGAGAGRYYLDGPDAGRWAGRGAPALGLDATPTADGLRRTLRGCDPTTGAPLGPRRRDRRAGWDLIFAAPKSVSLLTALAPAAEAEEVRRSHRRAVTATMGWLEDEASWARRGGQQVAAAGVVTAHFEHHRSAAGDPHLHTHVVLANLALGPDQRWSALVGSGVWTAGRVLGPLYDLALRHELRSAGLDLRWQLGSDHTADLADIPRPAIEATSTRRRQLQARLGRDDRRAEPSGPGRPAGPVAPGGSAGPADDAGPRRRELARVRSRGARLAGTWRQRLDDAGFGTSQVEALLIEARRGGPPAAVWSDPADGTAAHHWLGDRSSSWTRTDALRAVAATRPEGASPRAAWKMVDDLCAGAERTRTGRWTTPGSRRFDLALADEAQAVGPVRAPVDPRSLATALARRPALDGVQQALVRALVAGPAPVVVLPGVPGRSDLLGQAAVLDAARSAWEATGHRVTVDASGSAARRWEALTGLRADLPTDGPDRTGPPGPRGTGGVRVVDRADRRTSRELAGLVGAAAVSRTRLVLVEGGTLPALRHPTSDLLPALDPHRALPELGPAHEASRLRGPDTPDPLAPTRSRPAGSCAGRLPACVSTPRLVVSGSLPDAVDTMLDRWLTAPGDRPLLVGLGPAEIEGLNRAARSRLQAAGLVGPDEVQVAGQTFGRGDRVVARRSGPVPAGRLGTVEGTQARPAGLTVRWQGQDPGDAARLSARDVRRLAHGYAVGPGLAAVIGGPALVLGHPGRVGPARGRDTVGFVVAPTSTRTVPGDHRLTQLAEEVVRGPAQDAPGRAGPGRARPGHAGPGQAGPGQAGPGQGRPGGGWWASAADGGRPLAELAEQHERVGRDLRAGRPDGGPGLPGDPGRPRDAERPGERGDPRHAVAAPTWARDNRERLRTWLDLHDAMAERADLVAHAAEADPASPERHLMGPVPDAPDARRAWARAIRAVAVHADRWPEDRDRSTARDQDRARDQNRVREVGAAERLSGIRRDQALDGWERARTGRDLDPGRGL